jgi:dipeptidyl aminopeptidase/acylaminoacyl peptidase
VTVGIDTAATTRALDGSVPLIAGEVLFGPARRLSPALSPDGRRLAWLAPHGGVANVWVGDLETPKDGYPLTADGDRGVHAFCWAADGSRVLYVQDEAGENWRLCDVHLATGRRRVLTPAGAQAHLMKVSGAFPDRVLVALNADRPDRHAVYQLDLSTGELRKVFDNPGFIGLVADEGVGVRVGLVADEQLRVRAGLAPAADGGVTIMVRDGDGDRDGGPWRPLVAVDYADARSTRPLCFDADGTRLLCLTSHGAHTAQLVWFDVASGTRTVVAADPSYDVAAVDLAPGTNAPRLAYVQRERADPVVLDPAIAHDVAVLGGLGGDVRLLGGDDTDRIWLVCTVHDDRPIRYHVYFRDTAEVRFLFSQLPDLDRYTLAGTQPLRTRSRDGLTLHGYLTFPPGERRDLPAVLLVHGGPWRRDRWGFDPQVQWLANRGYLVIQVNYRGSTGYGRDFFTAGDRQWGAGMHNDLLDTVAAVVEQGFADPGRVAIMGASYGGYAALVAAAFTPEVFCCAVAQSAPANLTTLLTSFPPHWTAEMAQVYRRVGDPATEADLLWSRSPLSRVDDIRIPVLVAHGANDPRVPQADAEQIIAALHRRGVPHTYLPYPDEGHGLVKPANRRHFYAAVERFLATHCGGRAEPTSSADSTAADSPATTAPARRTRC